MRYSKLRVAYFTGFLFGINIYKRILSFIISYFVYNKASILTFSNGLHCFSCSSLTDPNCDKPFNSSSQGINITKCNSNIYTGCYVNIKYI